MSKQSPRPHDKMQGVAFKVHESLKKDVFSFLEEYKEKEGPKLETLIDQYISKNLEVSNLEIQINDLTDENELKKTTDKVKKENLDKITIIKGRIETAISEKILLDKEIEELRTPIKELYEKYKKLGIVIEHDKGIGNEDDVYDNYKPLKISRRKNVSRTTAPEQFSIIFDNELKPFALFYGKADPNIPGAKAHTESGGFGQVKIAQNLESGELVAVKILKHTDEEEKLRKEITGLKMMDQLKGVVVRPGAGEGGKGYLFMKLSYGTSLDNIIWDKEKKGVKDLTQEECLKILKESAIQLQGLHKQNIIHRDIKLNNFMWDKQEGKVDLIDLADLVKLPQNTTETKVEGVYSQGYNAPEILNNKTFSKKTDAFAFGITAKLLLGAYMATELNSNKNSARNGLIEDFKNAIAPILDPPKNDEYSSPGEEQKKTEQLQNNLNNVMTKMRTQLQNPVINQLLDSIDAMTTSNPQERAENISNFIDSIQQIPEPKQTANLTKPHAMSTAFDNTVAFWKTQESKVFKSSNSPSNYEEIQSNASSPTDPSPKNPQSAPTSPDQFPNQSTKNPSPTHPKK